MSSRRAPGFHPGGAGKAAAWGALIDLAAEVLTVISVGGNYGGNAFAFFALP